MDVARVPGIGKSAGSVQCKMEMFTWTQALIGPSRLTVDVSHSNLDEIQLKILCEVVICHWCYSDNFGEDCVGGYCRRLGDMRVICTEGWWWSSIQSM